MTPLELLIVEVAVSTVGLFSYFLGQGILLQKSLKQDETDISNKQSQLKKAKEQLSRMQRTLDSNVTQLEVNCFSQPKFH